MSNAEKFLEEFGNIDDKFIEEAMNYTMKKRFNFKPIIAVAACAVFALAAIPVANHFASTPPVQGTQGAQSEKIGASGKFTVYESGVHASDSKLNAEHQTEYNINKEFEYFTDNEKSGTTKVIEFAGKVWEAPYHHTLNSPYYGDDLDMYLCEENGEQFLFCIDARTGALKGFNSSILKVENTGKKLTHDECFEIAKVYLADKVSDIESYTLQFSRDVEWRDGYLYQLNRTLNGIITSEYITIGVRNNGEIYSFRFHSSEAMDNVDVSAINMEIVNNEIDKKINSIYKNNYMINHNADSVILTRLEDGSFVFICEIEIEGMATENASISKDTCYLTILID